MAIFDTQLLFFHAGTAFNFTSGEYESVIGATSSCTSSVINLGVAEDMGIGDGEFVPKVYIVVGSTGFTSTCQSLRINAQFQGSTDSTTWTTYVESGALATSSFAAGQYILPVDVPRRPPGVSLPQYYRVNLALTGNGSSESISTGSLLGGIVIQRPDAVDTEGLYSAGFTVA